MTTTDHSAERVADLAAQLDQLDQRTRRLLALCAGYLAGRAAGGDSLARMLCDDVARLADDHTLTAIEVRELAAERGHDG